jgi:dTDP-4-dehydrorhamnose reductase
MKFLITGANGQLGQELQKLLRERGLNICCL